MLLLENDFQPRTIAGPYKCHPRFPHHTKLDNAFNGMGAGWKTLTMSSKYSLFYSFHLLLLIYKFLFYFNNFLTKLISHSVLHCTILRDTTLFSPRAQFPLELCFTTCVIQQRSCLWIL